MTIEFSLPEGVRFSEECGLHLVFQEVKIRGADEMFCQVSITEEGNGIDVKDTYSFKSWKAMKKQYPTLMDFLKTLSVNEYWDSKWRDYDRIYFIASMTGHEGLYDETETVWFDAEEEFQEA